MDFYFTGLTFLAFFPNWEKRTVFHRSFTSSDNCGQFCKLEIFKSCVWLCTVFSTHVYVWQLVQCLKAVWYVQWRIQPHLQHSNVFTSLYIACCVSTVLVASTVFVSTWMWPEIKCPESQEKWNTQKLFVSYIPVQCDLQCYKLVHSLSSKYCSCIYMDEAWDQVTTTTKNSAGVVNTSVF